MLVLWIIVAIVVIGLIVWLIARASGGWVSIRTETGARTEKLYSLQAHLKESGIKTRISGEGQQLMQLHVPKKSAEQAKSLIEEFEAQLK